MSVTRCQSELADFVPYRRIEFYALIQGQIYLLLPSPQVTKKDERRRETQGFLVKSNIGFFRKIF